MMKMAFNIPRVTIVSVIAGRVETGTHGVRRYR
jgi:hypothetical protein